MAILCVRANPPSTEHHYPALFIRGLTGACAHTRTHTEFLETRAFIIIFRPVNNQHLLCQLDVFTVLPGHTASA